MTKINYLIKININKDEYNSITKLPFRNNMYANDITKKIRHSEKQDQS